MASLVGQTLGQYQLIAQLGHGGMATVYKAYHARLDRYVALKMVHQMFMQDATFVARFEREAQIVARLDHPHIVPVYDFNEHDGQPYLVMKFIEGSTLKGVLAEKPLPLDDILRIMPPVAGALDYAHRQGVLHRDIKPSNIMIDTSGVPYLTDFGLARMVKSGESSLSHDLLLGTPNYISPEQGQGSAEITPRSDHYALGVVLYELLTGQVPFSADTPFAVVHSHIYVPPPPPSSINPAIPPALDAVLIRALAKNPADRYESAAALVEAFAAGVRAADIETINAQRAAMRRASGIPPFGQLAHVPADEDAPTLQTPPPIIESPLSGGGGQESPGAGSGSAPRRIVEAEFDFGNLGASLRQAGEKIRLSVEAAQNQTPSGVRKQKYAADSGAGSKEEWRDAGDAVMEVVESVFGVGDLDVAAENDQSAARKRAERQVKKRNEFVGHLTAYLAVNALVWTIYLAADGSARAAEGFTGEGSFPWALIVSMAWGSGLVAHAIETYYETGKRAARRLRVVRDAYRREFGASWAQVASKTELKRVRRRAEAPIKKKIEFFTHLGVYTVINAMLWVIYVFAQPDMVAEFDLEGVPVIGTDANFPWPLVVMLLWGIGLVASGVDALGANRHERSIDREVERERAYLEADKPKRALRSDADADALPVRLTQDGELTDSMIVEIEDEARGRKRR